MDITQDSSIYANGTVIADNFVIESFLAAGGMAQVYVAKQQNLGREVALKVLSPSFSMNQSVVMRFFREARVIAQLKHPSTVSVIDMGETPDHRLFFAMELLQGEELSERIKRGPLNAAEMLPIVRQVAGSLSEAHGLGIIHRDLKPDNIFLTSMNVVKVLDFGIAKLKNESENMAESERKLTKAGTAPGTPEYMSPEQARGKDLDARSDIYSLGIVMYEMLCGHPPFEESTYLGTILLQVQATPPALPDFVPEPLAHYIIDRLLSKDPKNRPDSAQQLIEELDELSRKYNFEGNSASEQEMEQLSQAKAEIEALRRKLEESNQEKAALNVDYARLTQAKVEAEALRSKLAQTQMELMKSSDNTPIFDSSVPIQTTPAMTRAPLSSQEIRVTTRQPAPMPEEGMRRMAPPPMQRTSQARLIPIQSGQYPAQQPMMQPPYGAQNLANAQSAMSMGMRSQPAMAPVSQMMPPNMGNMQGMPNSQNMYSPMPPQGMPMAQMPSRTNLQPVSMAPMKQSGMPGMPGMPSRTNLEPVSGARYGGQSYEVEPIIPPSPRRGGRIASSPAMPAASRTVGQGGYTDTSKLPFREMPDEVDYDDRDVEDIHASTQSRLKDPLTGRQMRQGASTSSANKETTFMSFSQPLCSKLGQGKLAEALELSKSVWNAVNDGPDAERVLMLSAGRQTNLGKIIELMVTRKKKFFATETWIINEVRVIEASGGRMDIRLRVVE